MLMGVLFRSVTNTVRQAGSNADALHWMGTPNHLWQNSTTGVASGTKK